MMMTPTKHDAFALMVALQNRPPVNAPVCSDEGIILYGAGSLGKLAANFFQYVHVPVCFAVDKNATPNMLAEYSIPVVKEASPSEHCGKIVLVSTLSEPYTKVAAELKACGWQTIYPFYDYVQNYRDCHPLNNGWFCGPLSSEDISNIVSVIEKLEDSHSLGAYLQFIAWRLLREDWLYDDAPVIPEERYFISPVIRALSSAERFVDVGSYDGRVLMGLLKRTQNKLESAIMFEPDTINMSQLDKNVQKMPKPLQAKIKLMSDVISDKSGMTSFSQGFDFASREGEIAASPHQASSLDDLSISPTFIKIHTEGNELSVLHGAEKTIMNNRPIIAVTVYHSRDGLWRIPAYLFALLDDYAFYFRGHSWCGTGAVFYAIPHNRK